MVLNLMKSVLLLKSRWLDQANQYWDKDKHISAACSLHKTFSAIPVRMRLQLCDTTKYPEKRYICAIPIFR